MERTCVECFDNLLSPDVVNLFGFRFRGRHYKCFSCNYRMCRGIFSHSSSCGWMQELYGLITSPGMTSLKEFSCPVSDGGCGKILFSISTAMTCTCKRKHLMFSRGPYYYCKRCCQLGPLGSIMCPRCKAPM